PYEVQILLPIYVGPAGCVGLVCRSPVARYKPSRKCETSAGDHRGISWFDLVLSYNQFRILDDGHHVSSHSSGTAHLLYRSNSFLPTRVGRRSRVYLRDVRDASIRAVSGRSIQQGRSHRRRVTILGEPASLYDVAFLVRAACLRLDTNEWDGIIERLPGCVYRAFARPAKPLVLLHSRHQGSGRGVS